MRRPRRHVPPWLDVAAFYMVWGVVTLVLVIVTCGSGCATTGPLFRTDVARTVPPDVVGRRLPSVGDCADALPLQAGEARDCRSMSIPPVVAAEIGTRLDIARLTTEALEICYERRAMDRNSCNVVVLQQQEQLRVARQAQARWFIVGAGIGSVSALTIALIIVGAAP